MSKTNKVTVPLVGDMYAVKNSDISVAAAVAAYIEEIETVSIRPDKHDFGDVDMKGLVWIDVPKIMTGFTDNSFDTTYINILNAFNAFASTPIKGSKFMDYTNLIDRAIQLSPDSSPIIIAALKAVSTKQGDTRSIHNDTDFWVSNLLTCRNIVPEESTLALYNIEYTNVDLHEGINKIMLFMELLQKHKHDDMLNECSNIYDVLFKLNVNAFLELHVEKFIVAEEKNKTAVSISHKMFDYDAAVEATLHLPFNEMLIVTITAIVHIYIAIGFTLVRNKSIIGIAKFLDLQRDSKDRAKLLTELVFDPIGFGKALNLFNEFTRGQTIMQADVKWKFSNIIPSVDLNSDVQSAVRDSAYPSALMATAQVDINISKAVPSIIQLVDYYLPEHMLEKGSIIDFHEVILRGKIHD